MKDLLSKVLPEGKFWTDTWSLVEGCSPVSPGCKNCWLAGIYRRNLPALTPGLIEPQTGHFNGRVVCHEDRLEIPLRARKPRVYAIWSDLFHESVPFTFILKVLTTMALAPHHHFIIVTKRAKRAAGILAGRGGWTKGEWQKRLSLEAFFLYGEQAECQAHNAIESCLAPGYNVGWPLSNVTILVTMEDQQRADERAPYAMQLFAQGWRVGALCEPLLGPIMLHHPTNAPCCPTANWHVSSERNGYFCEMCGETTPHSPLSWIITGGESGPGARPIHPDWVRALRDQAQAAGVPFLFKGWGEWAPCRDDHPGFEGKWSADWDLLGCPQSAHLHEWGDHVAMLRAGKKNIRPILDGREHLEVPNASL